MNCERCGQPRVLLLTSYAECDCSDFPDLRIQINGNPSETMKSIEDLVLWKELWDVRGITLQEAVPNIDGFAILTVFHFNADAIRELKPGTIYTSLDVEGVCKLLGSLWQ